MNWDLTDYVVAGGLAGGLIALIALVIIKGPNIFYILAAGIALLTAFALIWVTLAVGIIGSEGHPANAVFAGVLALAGAGALLARFRPAGMARAIFLTMLVQIVVGITALVAGWGAGSANWPLDVLGATGMFAVLWLVSSWLFRISAWKQREAAA